MGRRRTAILNAVAALAILAGAAVFPALAEDPSPAAHPRPLPVLRPFGPGERLVFSIDYGLINGGEGVLSVVGMVEADGQECYHIESTALSNRFFSSFYKVRDKVTSYVDADSLFSRYFNKHLREGDYKKDEEVHFDHRRLKALYSQDREYDITYGVQDVLSAFYYVRTLDLEVGHDVYLAAHSSKKTYEMRVIVHRREVVKTDLGSFDCFVVQPIMLGEGLFKQEGDLVIYISADERRIPVLMKTKLPVGSITASLKEFTLAGPAGAGRD
jgi:hypothetical protein